MTDKDDHHKMGRWGATSYFIGSIVGSGIFITPTSILQKTQSVGLSLVVWLLSGVATTLGAYCYVELGTSIRRSGGDFAYLSHVKWRAVAFTFMSMGCLISYPLMLAVQSATFAEYAVQGIGLDSIIDAKCNPGAAFALRKLIAFSTLLLLLFLNFFSLRTVVARFQLITSFAKLLSALIIIGIGAFWLAIKGHTENLKEPFKNSSWETGSLANAFFAGLFNYEGWDVLNMGAEEVTNPRSTMSFAILVGMACILSIYLCINVAYFVVIPVAEIKHSNAVAMIFAEKTMGRSCQWIMPFIILLVLLNAMNGSMFAASRYLFAAARERQIPAFMACLNEKHESPRPALIIHVILVIGFSFLGDSDDLIGYLGFAQYLLRGITMCALLYMRLTDYPVHPQALRNPLIMPILFMSICFALASVTIVQDFGTAYIGLLVLAISCAIYLIFMWEHALPRFPKYRQVMHKLDALLVRIIQTTLGCQLGLPDGQKEDEENSASTAKPLSNGIVHPAFQFEESPKTAREEFKTEEEGTEKSNGIDASP